MGTSEHPPLQGDSGPLEYSGNDDYDRRLLAAREAFTDWDVYHLWFGYVAVPGGTSVYAASTVDRLVGKLRACGG
jgi:hypothetical protein